jgi:hypothetical protein
VVGHTDVRVWGFLTIGEFGMCDNRCEFEQQVNEEAHYYHVLNDFEELLTRYGARKVFGDLGTEFILKITRELSNE